MSAVEWMQACSDCVRLRRVYGWSTAPAECDEARGAIQRHIVAAHYDKLPYRTDCEVCADFRRVMGLGPHQVSPKIGLLLKRIYDEHRADHVIRDFYQRRRTAA